MKLFKRFTRFVGNSLKRKKMYTPTDLSSIETILSNTIHSLVSVGLVKNNMVKDYQSKDELRYSVYFRTDEVVKIFLKVDTQPVFTLNISCSVSTMDVDKLDVLSHVLQGEKNYLQHHFYVFMKNYVYVY
jgi:hypothetical protein